MWPSLKGKTALVTGGTRGIGLAIGIALGRHGARVWLTHRWGSVRNEDVVAAFKQAGAGVPTIIEADASLDEDTETLLHNMAAEVERVDIFVSNVSIAARGTDLQGFSWRELRRSLRYSAWPTRTYLRQIDATFGVMPSVLIATSSDGPDHYYPGYDFVAASKAALEGICRDLHRQHGPKGTKVFVLRSRQVTTDSYEQIFGSEVCELINRFSDFSVESHEVADAALMMASGLLDGLQGQVLSIDKGASILDNVLCMAPLILGDSA